MNNTDIMREDHSQKLTYSLTRGELIEASLLIAMASILSKRNFAIYGGVCIGAIAQYIFFPQLADCPILPIWLCGAIPLFSLVLMPLIVVINAASAYTKNPSFYENIVLSITPDGIRTSTQGADWKGRYDWRIIRAIYRKRNFGLIQIAKARHMCLTIPARVLPDGNLNRFLESLKNDWRQGQLDLLNSPVDEPHSPEGSTAPSAPDVVHQVHYSFDFPELLKANLLLKAQLFRSPAAIALCVVFFLSLASLLSAAHSQALQISLLFSFLIPALLFLLLTPLIFAGALWASFKGNRSNFENITVELTPQKVIFSGSVIGISTEIEWQKFKRVKRMGEFVALVMSDYPTSAIIIPARTCAPGEFTAIEEFAVQAWNRAQRPEISKAS